MLPRNEISKYVRAYLWLCECLLSAGIYAFGEKEIVLNFQFMDQILWSQKESFAIYFIAFLSSTSDDLL